MKLEIIFSNGQVVAFCDPRRFARIRVRSNPTKTPPISDLARDPYTEDFDVEYIKESLVRTTMPIKTALLEQNRVFCGVGNWIADEILFQSGIHPSTPSNGLSSHALSAMAIKTKHIISMAVELQVQGLDLPIDWLFHYRWDKRKSKGKGIDAVCSMPDGREIIFETVSGRTTAVVPSVQLKGKATKRKSIEIEENIVTAEILDVTLKKKPKGKLKGKK